MLLSLIAVVCVTKHRDESSHFRGVLLRNQTVAEVRRSGFWFTSYSDGWRCRAPLGVAIFFRRMFASCMFHSSFVCRYFVARWSRLHVLPSGKNSSGGCGWRRIASPAPSVICLRPVSLMLLHLKRFVVLSSSSVYLMAFSSLMTVLTPYRVCWSFPTRSVRSFLSAVSRRGASR